MEEYNSEVHKDDSDFKGKTLHYPSIALMKRFLYFQSFLRERRYTYNEEDGLAFIEEITLHDSGLMGTLFRGARFTAVLLYTDTLFPTIPDFDYSHGVYVDWTNLLIRWYTPELYLRELLVKPAIKREE